MAPKRATTSKALAGGKPTKKAKKQQDDEERQDDFFLDSDDDRRSDDEGNEEDVETAEEKRLRLAQQYLEQMKAVEDDATSESGDEGDEEGGEGDALSERLKRDAAQAAGRLQRKIARSVSIPDQSQPSTSGSGVSWYGAGKLHRCHRLAVTAVALTADDTTAFTVSKDGTIFKWDLATMKKQQLHRPGHDKAAAEKQQGTTADWVYRGSRQGSTLALYAAAVSSDGMYLAVGGGDKAVHVFDACSGAYVKGYPGHKDIVSGLAFREGTHMLLSASFDRTVKLWSLDDGAYVDTLFGHQAEVLAVDILRAERAVSCGHDHTCRVWKIPEETQLVFRAQGTAVECCKYITGTEWISGGNDGSVALWAQTKKRPVQVVRNAHGSSEAAGEAAAASAPAGEAGAPGAGSAGRWVQSVAVCRGTDLMASGAGDGSIKLWCLDDSAKAAGGNAKLKLLGSLPAKGFVNGVQIARSGKFVVAAVGQEPRLGRWQREGKARNGLLVHRLDVSEVQ